MARFQEIYEILCKVQNATSFEATRQAGEIYAALQFGTIQHIFSGGLHEYLTAFLDSTHRLGSEIDTSFFDPTFPAAAPAPRVSL